MEKITSLTKVVRFSKQSRAGGRTVGLIIGSFDILHMGHVNLFRFAKEHAHILIVGIDNDKTIKKTKGGKRPVNNYKRRSQLLLELASIDKIFQIREVFKHGDKKSFECLEKIFKSIKPDYLFTSIKCDELWVRKRKLANSLGIKFLGERSKVMHTSDILRIIESEI